MHFFTETPNGMLAVSVNPSAFRDREYVLRVQERSSKRREYAEDEMFITKPLIPMLRTALDRIEESLNHAES